MRFWTLRWQILSVCERGGSHTERARAGPGERKGQRVPPWERPLAYSERHPMCLSPRGRVAAISRISSEAGTLPPPEREKGKGQRGGDAKAGETVALMERKGPGGGDSPPVTQRKPS